ncbi:MAG: DoxX family protein [Polyangiaceae bacterium]|nr:DoxX family protein [Polyangiaceae bacterium]
MTNHDHRSGALEMAARLRAQALHEVERVAWLAPLLGRLAVGLLFVSTGWGKVHDIPKVTQFFEHLGIPAPGFNAVVVGYSELICGSLLVVGLLTRLAALPLIVSMVVALLTAKASDIHGVFDLVGADEFTYLIVLVMIAILGPGAVALDRYVARALPPATDAH